MLPTCLFALSFSACKSDTKADLKASIDPNAPVTTVLKPESVLSTEGATEYLITEGVAYWQGKNTMGGAHNGQLTVAGGTLLVKEGRLIGGSATLDMRSLSVSDLKDAGEKAELETHLKDSDFFEVAKYPTGEFKILEVIASPQKDFDHVLNGELTLKGKTNTVNVPIKLSINGNTLKAESATFVINRTKWGITYSSGIIGTVKDKAIDDTVILSLTVLAKSK